MATVSPVGTNPPQLTSDGHPAVRLVIDVRRPVVAQHAVWRHLLPEVVAVDVLDREPQAVMPRMIVRRITREHVTGRCAQWMHEWSTAGAPVVRPSIGDGCVVASTFIRHDRRALRLTATSVDALGAILVELVERVAAGDQAVRGAPWCSR